MPPLIGVGTRCYRMWGIDFPWRLLKASGIHALRGFVWYTVVQLNKDIMVNNPCVVKNNRNPDWE